MYKWISKNQGLFVVSIINICLLIWIVGCESKVQSLIKDTKVTRDILAVELNTEVRRIENELLNLQETAQARFTELDRQDDIKVTLLDTLSIATQAGDFNSTGLITAIGTLTAIGLGIDNRIKDKVIKNRPLTSTIIATDIDRG